MSTIDASPSAGLPTAEVMQQSLSAPVSERLERWLAGDGGAPIFSRATPWASAGRAGPPCGAAGYPASSAARSSRVFTPSLR